MQFVFVRHAQPEWVRDGLAIDDPPLTEIGLAQADRTGTRFRGQSADVLLVSNLQRARQTAEPIARALGLEPQVSPWLAEIGSPVWQGTPAEQVERAFKEHRDKPIDDLWHGLDGGESFLDFHQRITAGLQGFLNDQGSECIRAEPSLWRHTAPERRVIVVAHAGTNATAIAYLLGIPPVPWEWERFVSFHASVSDVEPIDISTRHAYSLVRFADVAHLPPGLHTR